MVRDGRRGEWGVGGGGFAPWWPPYGGVRGAKNVNYSTPKFLTGDVRKNHELCLESLSLKGPSGTYGG